LNTPLPPFSYNIIIPGIIPTGIIFSFIYMCMQYLHYIHPPMPFPHLFFLPTGTTTLPLNQETRDGNVIRAFFNW
jgi:hypothetical protein